MRYMVSYWWIFTKIKCGEILDIRRELFDHATLEILDQVAMLLLVHEQLRGMSTTFKNSPDIDKPEANPDANFILEFSRELSTGMMSAIFWRSSKRGRLLAKSYKYARANIAEAMERAEKLKNQEIEGTDGKGNVIEIMVIGNLKYLRGIWSNKMA